MISKDDIKKLADLARIEIGENEAEKLAKEAEAILGYVSEVEEVDGDDTVKNSQNINVMRNDEVLEPFSTAEEIIEQFPEKEGRLLKVPKILP